MKGVQYNIIFLYALFRFLDFGIGSSKRRVYIDLLRKTCSILAFSPQTESGIRKANLFCPPLLYRRLDAHHYHITVFPSLPSPPRSAACLGFRLLPPRASSRRFISRCCRHSILLRCSSLIPLSSDLRPSSPPEQRPDARGQIWVLVAGLVYEKASRAWE
jgi:hypothetical protein